MEASKKIPQTDEIEIELSDKDITEVRYFVTDAVFKPIRNLPSLLETPAHAHNVMQSRIGNCYFLSALSTILEGDPHFLKKIISIDDTGKVKIRLHDIRNPNNVYIYKLDATKIQHTQMNTHTHDLIFLLEKAYAMHRQLHERVHQTEMEAEIIDELHQQQLDIPKTLSILKEKGVKNLPQQLLTKKFLVDISKKHRLNYNFSLAGGVSSGAFTALLGVPAIEYALDFKKNDYDFYLREFVENLVEVNVGGFSIPSLPNFSKEIITEMFGSLDAPEFINLLENMNFVVLNNALAELANRKEQHGSVSKKNLVIDFFTHIDGLNEETKAKLRAYFEEHIPRSKGYGEYSRAQEEIYMMVRNKLLQGQFVTFGSQEYVGKNPESEKLYAHETRSKGLAGSHVYQVVSAYERDGLKYFLVRNPWGEYVRDYEEKKKMVDDHEVSVLTAKGKKQLPANDKTFSLISFFKSNSNNDQRENYRKYGYFEFELTDLKRMSHIYYTDKEGGVLPLHNRSINRLHTFLSEICDAYIKQGGKIPLKKTTAFTMLEQRICEKENKFIQHNMAIDMYAALAVYHKLIGSDKQSNYYLEKLNKHVKENKLWTFEDALEYVKMKNIDALPEIKIILFEQNKSLRLS